MNPGDRIFVAGHQGLVGSALVRCLEQAGCGSLILRTRSELDLRDVTAVREFLAIERPTHVFAAAAHVGGIAANAASPVEFLRDNLAIELALIDGAHRAGVHHLLFLGSSCVYPREAPQPMKEEYLLTGPLEPTNRAYALAKLAGIELCEAYRRQHGRRYFSVMPTNLYGPGDNFDLEMSHVVPALMRRFHDAKQAGTDSVTLWGSGLPRREFLHVDDLARACVFLMERYRPEGIINIGAGREVSIRELAALMADVVGWNGSVTWDTSRPDGPARKLLDSSRLNALGWRPRIPLEEGLAATYDWYRTSLAEGAAIRQRADAPA